MGVFATKILAFSFMVGHPVDISFSNKNPSSKNDSLREPPNFLIIWICSKFPDLFNLKTAFTASYAKCSFS